MKKISIAIMIALIAMLTVGVQAEEKEYRPGVVSSSKLDIDVWVDNEDGIYYEGESITIFFHANRDCFVAIYSLDTRGNINLLYPADPWDNGFVYGGEVYAIPADYDDYELIVTGPEGIEHIQAIASPAEMVIPDWFGGSPVRSDRYDDTEDFLDFINGKYFVGSRENRFRAFDRTTVYVKAHRYYYKPVYVPNHWYGYPHYSMVYFDYPFGAEIYIDGIYFGIAPLWIPRVMIGWHWVTIYNRYGYCWESNIHFMRDHTIRLDRTRVKPSRTMVSRYKDIRTQTKKYNKSSYVLSDSKVKTTRSTVTKKGTTQSKLPDYRARKSTTIQKERGYTTKKTGTGKSNRIEDSWNTKRSGTKKSDNTGTKTSGVSKRSTPDYRKSGSGSTKSTGGIKSGGSKKSTGSTIKKSTGSSKQSSGKSYKSSGSSKKPSGSKNSSGKSSPTKKSGGNVSKSSGSSKSSSIGPSSGGRSTSGKSSPSRSSSKGGGKRK